MTESDTFSHDVTQKESFYCCDMVEEKSGSDITEMDGTAAVHIHLRSMSVRGCKNKRKFVFGIQNLYSVNN